MAKVSKKEATADTKTNPIDKCQTNECRKVAQNKCKYCNREYCNEHLEARLVTNPRTIWSLEKSNPLLDELVREWNSIDGHSCANYTELRYKKYREESNRHNVDWNAIIERRNQNKTIRYLGEPSFVEHKTYSSHTQEQEIWYHKHAKVVCSCMLAICCVAFIFVLYNV